MQFVTNSNFKYVSFGQRNNLFSCHTHTHTHRCILYIFSTSVELWMQMRNATQWQRALCRIYRCSASPTDVPATSLPCLPYLLSTPTPSAPPSCLQWQQIRHDCSQTRFELSRVKSLLKLRDICRALSRICWQSYIVYTTLYSLHKSYANSLAEGAEGERCNDIHQLPFLC